MTANTLYYIVCDELEGYTKTLIIIKLILISYSFVIAQFLAVEIIYTLYRLLIRILDVEKRI